MFSVHLLAALSIVLPTSAWTFGPECASTSWYGIVASTILNPPTTAAVPSYTPTSFCSSLLQQTATHEIPITSTGTSTSTKTLTIPHTTTITDSSSPTSTVYCPLPSAKPICGLKFNNIVSPQVMNQIYNPESGSTAYGYVTESECHELCVSRSDCHSFLLEGSNPPGSPKPCSLFRENLGENGTRAEPNPEFVPQWPAWYERNCQMWLPALCTHKPTTLQVKRQDPSSTTPETTIEPEPITLFLPTTTTITPTGPIEEPSSTTLEPEPTEPFTLTLHLPTTTTPSPADPTITASPLLVKKREITNIPDYLSSYSWISYFQLSSGCSCVITSALPSVDVTTTGTYTKWLGTVTTTSTTDSTRYSFTTPHYATTTTSIL